MVSPLIKKAAFAVGAQRIFLFNMSPQIAAIVKLLPVPFNRNKLNYCMFYFMNKYTNDREYLPSH